MPATSARYAPRASHPPADAAVTPSATRSRNIQPTLVQKQDEQKQIAAALKTAGFSLTWQPAQQVRFRELQADPLAGAVAA